MSKVALTRRDVIISRESKNDELTLLTSVLFEMLLVSLLLRMFHVFFVPLMVRTPAVIKTFYSKEKRMILD